MKVTLWMALNKQDVCTVPEPVGMRHGTWFNIKRCIIPQFQKVIKTCFSSDDLISHNKINHSLQSPPINLATTAEIKVEQIGFSFVTKLGVVVL